MRAVLLGLTGLSLLAACGSDDGPAAAPPPISRSLEVSPRWEWSDVETGPGITVRVLLTLTQSFNRPGPQDCGVLPSDLRVLVNDRPATIVDPGGPLMGGLSGTEFRYCKHQGFLEAGPFTAAAVRDLRVRTEEGTTVSYAELGSLIRTAKLGAVPAQVKLGEALSLPVETEPYPFISHAELEWQEGDTTRRRGAVVGRVDRIWQVRAVAGPGRVKITLVGMALNFDKAPRCEGFFDCRTEMLTLLGPIDVEVLP
jgi:hypothetical protein